MKGCKCLAEKRGNVELFVIYDVFGVEEELDLDDPEDDHVPGSESQYDEFMRLIKAGVCNS